MADIILVVVVVPCLPREAAVEWHIIAVADEPFRRKHFALKKISEVLQIACEAVASSSASNTSLSISLRRASYSISSPDWNRTLEDLMIVFVHSRRILPEDNQAAPLCFRIFYWKNTALMLKFYKQVRELLEKWKYQLGITSHMYACQSGRERENNISNRGYFAPSPVDESECEMGDVNPLVTLFISVLLCRLYEPFTTLQVIPVFKEMPFPNCIILSCFPNHTVHVIHFHTHICK